MILLHPLTPDHLAQVANRLGNHPAGTGQPVEQLRREFRQAQAGAAMRRAIKSWI